MKIMVAYDGTLQAKKALRYGIAKARERQGDIVVLSVFNGPLFVDYDAGPNARTAAMTEFRRTVDEARVLLREEAQGVTASMFAADGDPEAVLLGFAAQEKASLLLCPSRYREVMAKYRPAAGKRTIEEYGSCAEIAGEDPLHH